MTDITIRPAEARDEAAWRRLWAGYISFYRAVVPEATTAATLTRLLDPASPMACLLAERDGTVIGMTNYVLHESTWDTRPICYLQDLYVDPAARGGGAAKLLILAVEQAARDLGCFRVYWQTQEYNAPARSLYDTITPRSSFIVYRKSL
jgi:GNAT superfamily N-acetyltransferase